MLGISCDILGKRSGKPSDAPGSSGNQVRSLWAGDIDLVVVYAPTEKTINLEASQIQSVFYHSWLLGVIGIT